MKALKLFFLLALPLLFAACSSTQIEDKVEQEVTEQPARRMHGEVAQKGMSAIENSSLSTEEKERIQELHSRMSKDTFRIQNEISKLKGVLFETFVTKPYDAKKVNVVKKRLLALNNEKMNNMLNALKEMENILGHIQPEEREIFLRRVMEFDHY